MQNHKIIKARNNLSSISQRKVRELHAIGENSKLDYKLSYNLRDDTSKTELAKDVSAIANYLYQTSGQGYLIIGTNDSGNPVGINPSDYSETRIQQIISGRTDPPPTFTVHYVDYLGVNLLIIELRRNPSGPHQLKHNNRPAGFPIRRGSTTGMMTTNEVFQAMQIRGRSFTRQRSEYETLSPSVRYRTIREDCRLGLVELGVLESSIVSIDYTGARATASTYGPPRTFLRIVKVINSRRWNLYFSFHADNASQSDLFGLEGSIGGLVNEHSLPNHCSIFIHFVHGTLSSSYFTNRERYWSGFVRIRIEPQITYFGFGQGVSGRGYVGDMYLPKFLVSHIKSKEDMKTRIELILNWIEQHQQMFEDIRNIFQR
jgi:hypothetical protein